MHRENAEYYTRLAPGHFRVPDAESLAEFMEPRSDENAEPTLAPVAELDGELAGYLEARLEDPLESAAFQANPDLAEVRLFINYLETVQTHWRRGVGTRLVGEAEAWGRARGATVAICDTYVGSPVSIPFWEERMGYERRTVVLRKPLA